MPPRLVSLAILLYWVVAASSLIRRDILPEMGFDRAPDLRTIAGAEAYAEPARWSVEVIDNPLFPESRRAVGEAETASRREPDEWLTLTTKVAFNAGGLLKGSPFRNDTDVELEVLSTYRIDPSGNLRSFLATVKSLPDLEEWLTVEGQLKNHAMEVVSKGRLPILNQKRSFPYQPRGLMQNALGPFDRLPGLQVGQRWETRIINPVTGGIDKVRVEVARRSVIHWDKSPVTTLEVVQHLTPLSARTWVRPDGVVLRQEVPFPFVRLVLERLPDHATVPSAEATPR